MTTQAAILVGLALYAGMKTLVFTDFLQAVILLGGVGFLTKAACRRMIWR